MKKSTYKRLLALAVCAAMLLTGLVLPAAADETEVVAMRNVSTSVMLDEDGTVTLPELPATVCGLLADGTVSGTYSVTWETVPDEDLEDLGDGDLVEVTGTVTGSSLPVTCFVRIVDWKSTSAGPRSTVTQDIPEAYQSDVLSSIINGTICNDDDTTERWSNYSYREISNTAALTFTWSEQERISSIDLYFYTDTNTCRVPSDVVIEYSANGTSFTELAYTAEAQAQDNLVRPYSYTFSPVTVKAVRITLTQPDHETEGSYYCVGLTEAVFNTVAGWLPQSHGTGIDFAVANRLPVSGVNPDTDTYYFTEINSVDDIWSADNAAYTILPKNGDEIRVVMLSEDGSATHTYIFTEAAPPACTHENTFVVGWTTQPTCTEEGYIGNRYCEDCYELLEAGHVLPATGHTSATRDAVTATCTTDGHSGATYCTVCNEILSGGEVIPATGHDYDEGTVTAEPTCTSSGNVVYECRNCGTHKTGPAGVYTPHTWDEGTVTTAATASSNGVMTYECTVCHTTKTEVIPATAPLPAPEVTVSAKRAATGVRLSFTGAVSDYANISDYAAIIDHGFVLIAKTTLGNKSLTVDTQGVTKVKSSSYRANGTYTYTIARVASQTTQYVCRAYLTYQNAAGEICYVYSAPVVVSYSTASR